MTWQNLNALFEENYWLNLEQRESIKKNDKKDSKDPYAEIRSMSGVGKM